MPLDMRIEVNSEAMGLPSSPASLPSLTGLVTEVKPHGKMVAGAWVGPGGASGHS